jgi:uncharacterized glyoxalase superfamily protein PhnB
MLSNRSMPAVHVIPVLTYPDVNKAAEWLCAAFGFSARLRIGDHRAQLNVEEGAVILAQGGDSSLSNSDSLMVRVCDVDSHHERSRENGARIVSPPSDYPYGERQYTAEDLSGRRWTFSQSIADVDPAEWGGTLV